MGLGSLKKIKKAEQSVFVADLSAYADGEDVKISFRRPKAPDYFPPATLRKDLLIAFAELNTADPILISYVLIMGACYIPEENEQGQQPWRAIAQISRDNPEAFMDLVRQFGEAFPADVAEAKEQAKND